MLYVIDKMTSHVFWLFTVSHAYGYLYVFSCIFACTFSITVRCSHCQMCVNRLYGCAAVFTAFSCFQFFAWPFIAPNKHNASFVRSLTPKKCFVGGFIGRSYVHVAHSFVFPLLLFMQVAVRARVTLSRLHAHFVEFSMDRSMCILGEFTYIGIWSSRCCKNAHRKNANEFFSA